jgi:hypothetical protein
VYHVLPDIRRPVFTATNVLDAMEAQLPDDLRTTIYCDAFFTCIPWFKNCRHQFVASLSKTRFNSIFYHHLKSHQYRVYQHGSLVVSVWVDNNVVVTLTNRYNVVDKNSVVVGGIDTSGLRPLLNAADTQSLCALSLEGLQALTAAVGKPTSGTKQQLACRIANRPVPVADIEVKEMEVDDSDDEDDDADEIKNEEQYRQARKKELEARTKDELVKHLSVLRAGTTGSKDKLIKRIIEMEVDRDPTAIGLARLDHFTGFVRTTKKSDQPIVQQDYMTNFNLVDRLNRTTSSIRLKTRFTDFDYRLFVGIVELCIVCAFHAANEVKFVPGADSHYRSCQKFARMISDELFTECN